MNRRSTGELLVVAALALAGSVLLFWRLGDKYLWQDEAATAVLGERMMHYGRPLAYDGKNLITMDSFADEDVATIDARTSDAGVALRYLVARRDFKPDTTWTGHPWGQFVAAGFSLALLGHGTVAARLPFALAGLLTVLLLYYHARRVFGSRAVALLACLLLLANGFWVLHARQSRYYALSSLALLLCLVAFDRWAGRQRCGGPLFVLAGWFLFQSDFGSFWPSMAVFALVAAWFAWPSIGGALGVFAALAAAVAPWVWYYDLASRLRASASPLSARILGSIWKMNLYLIPLALLVLMVVVLSIAWKRVPEAHRRTLLVGVGLPVVMLIWVPAVAPGPYHRYYVQITPVVCAAVAWLAAYSVRVVAPHSGWGRRAALAVVGVVLVLSRLPAIPVAATFPGAIRGAPLSDYLVRPEISLMFSEVFGHRPDPNRRIIEAVRPLLRPGDEILVNYEDIPFMFYTDARVRGGVAAFRVEDRASAPRFLVLRMSVPFVHWRIFWREAGRHQWQRIPTGAPDIPFGNNPDPDWHANWARPRGEVFVGERAGALGSPR